MGERSLDVREAAGSSPAMSTYVQDTEQGVRWLGNRTSTDRVTTEGDRASLISPSSSMGERLVYTQEVAGSSPALETQQ